MRGIGIDSQGGLNTKGKIQLVLGRLRTILMVRSASSD